MFEEQPRAKKYLFIVALCGLFLVTLWLVLSLSHRGKTKVEVTVAPKDSQVYINGSPHSAGTVYLKPGNYTFLAKRTDFADDQQFVKIGTKATSIGLTPTPNSAAAIKYLEENPGVQAAREAIGGQRAQTEGLRIKEQTPLISQLPYTDIDGPFTVDYGPSLNRKGGVFLQINNSSPSGRVSALRWIRQQGYDPTDFEIRYTGFANPLEQGGGE